MLKKLVKTRPLLLGAVLLAVVAALAALYLSEPKGHLVLDRNGAEILAKALDVNGSSIVDGFSPDSLQVGEQGAIFGLIDADGHTAKFTLTLPDSKPGDCLKTRFFNVRWLGTGKPPEALSSWVATRLEQNLKSSPWIEVQGPGAGGKSNRNLFSKYFWYRLYDNVEAWARDAAETSFTLPISPDLHRMVSSFLFSLLFPFIFILISAYIFYKFFHKTILPHRHINYIKSTIIVGLPICFGIFIYFHMSSLLQFDDSINVTWWQFLTGLLFAWLFTASLYLPKALDRTPQPKWEASLLALFVLAAAVRSSLPPLAPFHENQGSYEVIWVGDESHLGPPLMLGKCVLYPVLLKLFHLADQEVFFFNIVISALAAPICAALGKELLESRRAGWFAGLAIALSPLAIRLGSSESFFNLASTLTLLAIWLGLRSLRLRDEVGMYFSALTMSLAVTVRVLTVLYAIIYLLLLLPAAWRNRRELAVWLTGMPFLFSLAHGLVMISGFAAGGPSMTGAPKDLVFLHGLLISTEVIPPLFTLLGILGAGLLLSTRPSAGLAVSAAVLGAQLIGSLISVDYNRDLPAYSRHMLLSIHLWALPFGFAAARLLRYADPMFKRFHLQRSAGVALSLVVASASLVNLDFITHKFPENLQFQHISREGHRIAADSRLYEYHINGIGQVAGSEWMKAKLRHDKVATTREKPITTFLYLGIACYSVNGHAQETPVPGETFVMTRYGLMRRECADALAARDWKEVYKVHVPGESYMGYPVRPFRTRIPLIWLQD